MKKIIFSTILLSLFVSININAAPEPNVEATASYSKVLNGIVADNQTDEALTGAIITANGQKVYTDFDGNFKLSNLCDGKCELKISMISYQDQTLMVDLNNIETLQVKLQQR